MSNSYFQFKQFTVHQERCAMKVTTDACLFGAIVANETGSRKLKVENCLDIGTGTALLSLMLIQKNYEIKIDTVEIDKDAAEQAVENVQSSPWKNRINVINADIRTLALAKKYDLIICNPPFYEKELKSIDEKRNRALHSDELSLDTVLDIIKKNLVAEGEFYLLLPYKRNEEIKKLLVMKEFHVIKMVFVKQSVNHDYFRIILSGKINSPGPIETRIDEISILDDKQEYTSEFTRLLKDYYLHL